MSTPPLARLRASRPRRIAATAMLAALSALLLLTGIEVARDSLAEGAFILAVGIAAFLLAWGFWRGSAGEIWLTHDGLFMNDGTLIAPIETITSLDRGLFAFKPSGGFLLRLERPLPRRLRAGLWWRFGRNIGVGGVTGRAEARLMADLLATMIATRNG